MDEDNQKTLCEILDDKEKENKEKLQLGELIKSMWTNGEPLPLKIREKCEELGMPRRQRYAFEIAPGTERLELVKWLRRNTEFGLRELVPWMIEVFEHESVAKKTLRFEVDFVMTYGPPMGVRRIF